MSEIYDYYLENIVNKNTHNEMTMNKFVRSEYDYVITTKQSHAVNTKYNVHKNDSNAICMTIPVLYQAEDDSSLVHVV